MASTRRPITYEIAKTYIENNPQRGSKTIARMLRQDEPEVFSSIEQARSVVRKIRGNAGPSSRKYGDKSLKKPNAKPGQFQVPEGVRQGQSPVQVDWGKYLLLSDLHVPYHDQQLVEIALTIALEKGCDGIYLNGDSIDFYKLSRFIQDPRMRSARRERDTLHEILSIFAKHFDKRYYKVGNHEERWMAYIFTRAEEFAEFEEFDLQNVLGLSQLKYVYVKGKQRACFGKLNVVHGHEVPRGISNPVNPARGLWMRLKQTALCGHHHRSSQHNESHPMKKEVSCTWSVGCGCDLEPEFMPLNEWNLGFAIIDNQPARFCVENYLVERGQAYPI